MDQSAGNTGSGTRLDEAIAGDEHVTRLQTASGGTARTTHAASGVFMKRALLTCGLGVALVCAVWATDFWLQKPYTQWQVNEARQILTRSPWTYVYQWGYIGSIQQNIAGTGDPEREFVVIIRAHLFSARAVRQAYVALIAQGDQNRLARYRDIATRDYPDEIVVSLTVDSKPKGVSAVFDVERALHNLSLPELRSNTFLATNSGKKVYIKDYLAPTPDGSGAKFIFPRYADDGVPLVTRDDTTLRFQTTKIKIKSLSDLEEDENRPSENVAYVLSTRTLIQNEMEIDATFMIAKLLLNNRLDF
ncbi:MAG: hypothetical protein GX414_12785 [Acidobacteria bacterium]|nr:hypothetical protein [Acidobacteriota bacterium]